MNQIEMKRKDEAYKFGMKTIKTKHYIHPKIIIRKHTKVKNIFFLGFTFVQEYRISQLS